MAINSRALFIHIHEISNIRDINISISIINYFQTHSIIMDNDLTGYSSMMQFHNFFNAVGLHMHENHHNCIFMNINEKNVYLVTNNIKKNGCLPTYLSIHLF